VGGDNESGSGDKFDLFQRNVNFLEITSLTLFDVSVDSLDASCVSIFFIRFMAILVYLLVWYDSQWSVSTALFRKQQLGESFSSRWGKHCKDQSRWTKPGQNARAEVSCVFQHSVYGCCHRRMLLVLDSRKTKSCNAAKSNFNFHCAHLQYFIARRPLVTAKISPKVARPLSSVQVL